MNFIKKLIHFLFDDYSSYCEHCSAKYCHPNACEDDCYCDDCIDGNKFIDERLLE